MERVGAGRRQTDDGTHISITERPAPAFTEMATANGTQSVRMEVKTGWVSEF